MPIPRQPISSADMVEDSILQGQPLSFDTPDSALVVWGEYDPGQRKLRLELKAGALTKTYEYTGVQPSAWLELVNAPSKGAAFSRLIRPHFQGRLVG